MGFEEMGMVPPALSLVGGVVASMLTEELVYVIITALGLPTLYVIFWYYKIRPEKEV